MRTNNAPLSHHRHRTGITRQGTARSFIRGAHIGHYTPEKTRTHEGLKVARAGASSVAFLMKQEATT